MGLDRKEPEYRAIEALMDEDLRTALDRIIDQRRDRESTGSLRASISNAPASHSEKARLRLAMWFWNGDIPIKKDDVLCLDPENRGRFVDAMALALGLMEPIGTFKIPPLPPQVADEYELAKAMAGVREGLIAALDGHERREHRIVEGTRLTEKSLPCRTERMNAIAYLAHAVGLTIADFPQIAIRIARMTEEHEKAFHPEGGDAA